MLTRNKKKGLARKDKSCPQNLNQNDSTVPGNGAVGVGAMVTVDHGGTRGNLDHDCQKTDFLQVAWLLREKLNDLVDGDDGEFPEVGLRSLLDMAASHNIVSVDPKMLNPVLWRTLPRELLLLVFARLTVPDITRLRSLSREWRKDLATANSDINQACQEASPTMVALLSHTSTDAFLVTIYDITNCKWQYAYELHVRRPWNNGFEQCPHTWTPVDACDCGLVCFMSLWKPTKHKRLCIVVVNLLTRVQRELPPLHYQYVTLLAMVQLKVDLDTKCYKVVVAAYKRGGLTVEIFDSGTGQWTRAAPPSGSIFGPVHTWTSGTRSRYKLSHMMPGAYDFAERKLRLYSEFNPSNTKESVLDWVLEKDHLFVVQEQTQMNASHRRIEHESFCLAEYHLEDQTWVRWRILECPFFEELIEEELSALSLHACDGLLMVVFHYDKSRQEFRLLDLSTSEWSKLPENSNSKRLYTPQSFMCRVFWNAIA